MTTRRIRTLAILLILMSDCWGQFSGEQIAYNEIPSEAGRSGVSNAELERRINILHGMLLRAQAEGAAAMTSLEAEVDSLHDRVATLEHLLDPVQSCHDAYIREGEVNGIVDLWPQVGGPSFPAYCEYSDGHEWTVLQHRVDDSVNFNRNWAEYRDGFGNMGEDSNFWLGLEKLRVLMSDPNQTYLLRIDLHDWDGETAYAEYTDFTISSEADGYRIHYSFSGGPAGDSLDAQGVPFSTKDRDHDTWEGSCSVNYSAGWWFKGCLCSNLNGRYHYPPDIDHNKGIQWEMWKGAYHSLKESKMKIRPTRK